MRLADKNVLVTGGAGAIGSRLVRRLAEHGNRVLVLDDLSSGHASNVPDDPGVRLVEAPVQRLETLAEVFAEPFDCVFHLAALFANQNSIEHPQTDLEVNGLGTLRLLEAARAAGVGRFVYASSSCVYGSSAEPLAEEHPLGGSTPYAITKLLGEQYARFYAQFHDLPVSIVRYFNSYGPGEHPGQYRNVIPNFIATALAGRPLPITGTGEEQRDFTYVDDVVEGTLLAAEVDAAIGGTFNLGSGVPTSIAELATLINELTANEAGVELRGRRDWDHVSFRCADISRARRELGFSPSVTLPQGLERTVRWLSARGAVAAGLGSP